MSLRVEDDLKVMEDDKRVVDDLKVMEDEPWKMTS